MKKNKDLWARVSELTQRNILPQQEVSLPAIEEMPMVPEDAASLYLGEPTEVSMNREPQGAFSQADALAAQTLAKSYKPQKAADISDAEYQRRIRDALSIVTPEEFAGNDGILSKKEIDAYHDARNAAGLERGFKNFADVIQGSPSAWFNLILPDLQNQLVPMSPMDRRFPEPIRPWFQERAPGVPALTPVPPQPKPTDLDMIASIGSPWLSLSV